MPGSRYIEKVVFQILRGIALIGLVGLLTLSCATVLDILLRWLFNSPIFGLDDVYGLFVSVIMASCFPLCIYSRGNVTVRAFGMLFGKRGNDILDIVGNVVTLMVANHGIPEVV